MSENESISQTVEGASFEKLKPKLKALAAEKVLSPRVDVEAAALKVLGVCRLLQRREVRERYLAIPEPLFDHGLLDLMPESARATQWARLQANGGSASKAKLPEDLAQQAFQLKNVMLKEVDHVLGDQLSVAQKLVEIRAGFGYADAANDLNELAIIYRTQKGELAKDAAKYHAEDADTADRLATQIRNELASAGSKKDREAQDLLNRAWTLCSQTYEEVAATGRWLMRHDDGANLDELFPSLYASKAPRKKKGPAPTPDPVAPPTA